MRYERKFMITDYSFRDVEQVLKFHPACFSEVYYERVVNNLYFDSLDFTNYYDNVEGSPERQKVRIRWYGSTFGEIEKPVLEFKIKSGLLGTKESYQLNSFKLNADFSLSEISKMLNIEALPKHIKNQLVSLKPSLLNSYTRKYFLSADKNYRATIDHRMTFYRVGILGNTFAAKSVDYNSTVMEIKYEAAMEADAKLVINHFPFSITKSSKYLQGLERVLN